MVILNNFNELYGTFLQDKQLLLLQELVYQHKKLWMGKLSPK